MMVRLVILALIISLSGCGIAKKKERMANFNQMNDALVGRHVDEVIKAYGVPSGEAKLSSGGRVIEYAKERTEVSGGGSYSTPTSTYVANPYGYGGTWVHGTQQKSIPVSSIAKNCKITFVISPQDTVESWKYEGNDCY